MTIEELRVLITAKTEGLQEGINKATSRLKDFKGTTDNMESSTTKNINRMKGQYDSLIKKLDNVNAQAELQQRKLNNMREKFSGYSGVRADSPKAIRLQEQILSTESKLQRLIDTSDKTVNSIEDLDNKMSSAGISTGATKDRFQSLRDKLDQVKNKFKRTGEEAQRSTGKVAGFANMLNRSFMRILKRIFIFNLIYKMIRGLIGYMNGALKTNSQFTSSLQTIGTNLRVAFQPIYDFILPAINALMRALATITSYIASFTSALFGKTYKQSYDAAKGIETAKKAMDGYGASAKKAKGQLAGFDEINVLNTDNDSGGGGGSNDFEMSVPEIPEFELGWLDKFKEKLEPTIEAIQRLVKGLDPLKDFVAQGAMDFYNKFLVPVGNWVFGEGLPRFIDAITNGLAKIDWTRINESLGRLWDALAPFAINVGEGLLWLWENVLVPFGTWVMNEVVPRFLDILASVLDVLNEVIEALKPLGKWLWEEFLRPLAEWAGEKILDALDWLNEKLEKLSDWIKDNQGTVQTLAIIFGSLAVAWGLVNIAVGIWNVVGTIGAGVFAVLTSPITLVILAIGALIAIGVLLYKNWEEVSAFGTKTWNAFKQYYTDTFNDIKKYSLEVWENIRTSILNKWADIRTGIANMKDGLVAAIKLPFTIAKDWIDGIISDAYNWGKNLIGNIIDGINSMVDKVKSAVSNVASTIGNFLGFHSPAKLGPGRDADKWMPNMMNMLADGIKDNVYKIDASVNMAANSLSGVSKTDNASSIASAVSAALGEMNSGQQEITINFGGNMGQLIRVLKPYIDSENIRVGTSLVEGAR